MTGFMDYYDRSLIRFNADDHHSVYGTIIEDCQENRFFILTFFSFMEGQSKLDFFLPSCPDVDHSFSCRILHSRSQLIENEKITFLEVFFDKEIRSLFEGNVFRLKFDIDFTTAPTNFGKYHSGGHFYYWAPNAMEQPKEEGGIELIPRRIMTSNDLDPVPGHSFLYQGTFEGYASKGLPVIYGGEIMTYGSLVHAGNSFLAGFITKTISHVGGEDFILQIFEIAGIANLLTDLIKRK